MDSCDVVIAGGGPAGSTCAWKLRQAGYDVVVVDKATFPRDKVCAGWITPQVVEDLDLDLDDYKRRHTLQPITGFRVGVIGSRHDVAITYRRPVSYGIRRCEFDHYLLERSRARLHLGATVAGIRKEGAQWVVNERIKAPLLVGAGGHFCPVARMLNPGIENGPVVVAREAEFPIEAARAGEFAIEPDTPELYFCADLKGYGWGFGKQGYLNLGLGRLDRREAPAATRAFLDYLRARRKITSGSTGTWRGHAYLLSDSRRRQIVADGVMLLGDAAGLAYPHSGEGIRPAVESGLLAASTIVESGRSFSFDRLRRYQERLGERFGSPVTAREAQSPSRVALTAALGLLHVPWFVRHVVLDRWFLRAAEPALPHSRSMRRSR